MISDPATLQSQMTTSQTLVNSLSNVGNMLNQSAFS